MNLMLTMLLLSMTVCLGIRLRLRVRLEATTWLLTLSFGSACGHELAVRMMRALAQAALLMLIAAGEAS